MLCNNICSLLPDAASYWRESRLTWVIAGPWTYAGSGKEVRDDPGRGGTGVAQGGYVITHTGSGELIDV